MLHLSAQQRYFLFQGPADMRKGFDSLSGLVMTCMRQDPLSGDVFLFFNRRRNQVKLLHWEGDGFALYYKRLEKGTYELPVGSNTKISSQQLQLILQGISLKKYSTDCGIKKRPELSTFLLSFFEYQFLKSIYTQFVHSYLKGRVGDLFLVY